MSNERGWQANEAAERWRRTADLTVPGRSEVLDIISGLAVTLSPETKSILDLGCGYGDVTAAVLAKAPDVSIVMVDYSDEMDSPAS